MLKRFIPLAVSAAALLAIAAPAAQATGPLITNQFGEAVWKITPRSTNSTIKTASGTLECKTVRLAIYLATNANTTAYGSGTGTAEGTVPAKSHFGHCGTSGGIAVDFLSVSVSSFHLTKHLGETTGTATFAYTYSLTTIFGTAHCTFEGTGVPVKRTGTETINVAGSLTRTYGGALCPESGAFSGDFSVLGEIEVSPVIIH